MPAAPHSKYVKANCGALHTNKPKSAHTLMIILYCEIY